MEEGSCIFPETRYLSRLRVWDSSHVHESRDWKSSVRTRAGEDLEIWRPDTPVTPSYLREGMCEPR